MREPTALTHTTHIKGENRNMPTPVQTDDGFHPIPAVVSEEVDNLAVVYGDSNEDSWKVLAFKVNQINRRTQRVTNLPRLAPGGTLDFGYLGENGHSQDVSDAGQDQLRIEDAQEETLMEFGVAVKPDGVLVGVQNPSGEEITGVQDSDRLRGYGPSNANSSDFEDFGALQSDVTYTERTIPTTALSETPSQGIVRFDQDEGNHNNTYFGFYNQRETDAELEVKVHGAAYKVSNVTDPQTVRDIYFGNGYRRRVLTYGGLQNYSPKRPQSWRSGEVTVNADDARAALNGGGRA